MKETIRTLVRTLYDFQSMRIRSSNRLKLKKDGNYQKTKDLDIDPPSIPIIVDVMDTAKGVEKTLEKELVANLKEEPIYTNFLKHVKGVGPLMSAVVVSEYDIYEATTVSKMWQYTGLNSGMVRGKKRKETKDGYEIIVTDTMVRGDKLTPGFVAPFNKWLRTKMVGVLASSFIKCQSEYALLYYYPYKQRLENSENICFTTEKAWKEESKGHRDNAAKRYMIKMFLKDLYVAWRMIEGLEVRAPYQDDYLGHKHSA